MKSVIYIALTILAVAIVGYLVHSHQHQNQDYLKEFMAFQSQYGIKYGQAEFKQKYQIFSQNMNLIKSHNEKFNNGEETFTLGVNQFADLTEEEFQQTFCTMHNVDVHLLGIPTYHGQDGYPDQFDWRQKGAVAAIKNQKSCGSCYAFSAVTALESLHYNHDGKLVTMSEQEVVDCSKSYGNGGCRGGLMNNTFSYVQDHGIMRDADYQYVAYDQTCKAVESKKEFKVDGYQMVQTNSEKSMKSAIEKQVVSIAVYADQYFQMYSSGLFDIGKCLSRSNHGVAFVGYSTDHFILRNSWGTTWGENGYMRITNKYEQQGGCANIYKDGCIPLKK